MLVELRRVLHAARCATGPRVDPDPRAIVSPADGRIESIGRIDAGGNFLVKGRPYSVAELVGDAAEARRFLGGAGFVVYLSPRDYHRVHAPVAGVIRRIRSMPGDYFPVNADRAFATSRTSFAATAASPSRSTPREGSGASPSSWSWR